MQSKSGIIVFDGVCNLCSAVVDFISARDHANAFTFAPMQSPTGRELLERLGVSIDDVDTFFLVTDGGALVRSDAAIAIARELGTPWNCLAAFRLVPKPVRDCCYSVVARNRYKWFGKRASCKIPLKSA